MVAPIRPYYFTLPPLPSAFTSPHQAAWCELATGLFNIDCLDMLMTADEKHAALKDLSTQLTIFEWRNPRPTDNRTVMAARLMCKGEAPVDHAVIFTALLRWQLCPPHEWMEWETMHQHLSPLCYLADCGAGRASYCPKGMGERMRYVMGLEVE
ncbi:hypothetical protein CGRA01v4_08484 [Colletotrichum graminicola]|nr:hypothetical protein CGRA01v4_08484 [Colletotrichum graminicola]